MELRHLRYFVTVAEELSFTRAAKKLHIKQPPLSAQIRKLENELGTQLFRRLTRGVELTDAGKLLLEQARVILKQVEDAEVGVRRRGRGETGHIIVGSSGAIFHPLIVRALYEAKTRYPNLTIATELEVTNTSMLLAWLRTGRVDLCLLSVPIDDSEGLAIEPLVDEDCVTALPSGHAFANSPSLPLESLAKEKFVLFSRAFSPALYDSIMAACERAGFKPEMGQEVPQIVNVIPVIAAGFGISIIPRSFSAIHFAGVSYIDIDGEAPRSALALVYRRDERSAAVKNAIKAARVAKLAQ
ncbi:MAG TPA: LysR family transcriptional regulator [Xanthobacteraceae bacterium]|nr:LysR family transcriptional regulator [Xanthobacteraceae bacterium]